MHAGKTDLAKHSTSMGTGGKGPGGSRFDTTNSHKKKNITQIQEKNYATVARTKLVDG